MKKEWWYKFFPSAWWRYTKGMDSAQKGDFMDEATLALQSGERGGNKLADFMFAEMDKVSDAQRDRVKKRWDKQAPPSHPANTTEYHGIPRNTTELPRNADEIQKETETEEVDLKPETEDPPSPANAPGGWQFSEDKSNVASKTVGDALRNFGTPGKQNDPIGDFLRNPKERVWDLDNVLLVEATATYCGEPHYERGKNRWRKGLRLLGDRGYREELAAFIASVEAGEEADNRGAAFNKRLTEAEATKHEREKVAV